MNELLDICVQNSLVTDKYIGWSNLHSYVENFYSRVLPARRTSTKNLLEIGVAGGGSLILWHNYFPNAVIHAIDKDEHMGRKFIGHNRIKFALSDAYSDEIINKIPDGFFDIIIDDGPHTVESQCIFITKYLPKLAHGGLIVIEDIASEEALEQIGEAVPESLQDKICVWDGTAIDNRYDSRILYIQL
jgi:predicted O-methyltransferase YrrM